MSRQSAGDINLCRKLLVAAVGVAAVAGTLVIGLANTTHVRAQSRVPDWQIAAGGKMAFDVASIKRNTATHSSSTQNSNIPLGPMDFFSPTGGLLSATNSPLLQYMIFAYKLAPEEVQAVQSQLPKWANTERFDIEARATGNPTKDQFRLMMQALLADRFKLAMHYETRQVPVLALVFDKPGKMGPQFRAHVDDPPCSTTPAPLSAAMAFAGTVAAGFPELCGALLPVQPSTLSRLRIGARNVPMATLAKLVNSGVGRPVLDKTGLAGKVDFVIEFAPESGGPEPPGATQPDESGPTFLQALKEQLGLKLESQTGPVDVLVIDHVEEPSEN